MPPKARHADPAGYPPARAPIDRNVTDSDEEDEEEFDLIAVMADMTPNERRSVYALHGLLEEYKALRAKYLSAVDKVRQESHQRTEPIFEKRRAIVTGERDVTAEEIASLPASSSEGAATDAPAEGEKKVTVVAPNDEAMNAALLKAAQDPSGGIPNFWLTALSNSEVVGGMITERDRRALSALQDIKCDYIDGDAAKGIIISFRFAANPYFSDEVLTKTYQMEYNEEDGDLEVADIVGCEIHWTDAKHNLTVVVKEKKQRNKKNNQVRVVQREEKCESFFNFFSPPKAPATDADEDDEEDADFYEQEMEMDVEAGQAIMEEIVPKAAFYYSGKSIEEVAKMLAERFGFGAEEDEEDDDEEDEEDDEEEEDDGTGEAFHNIVSQRGRGAGGRGGARGGAGAGAGAPQQQECKQQ